MVFCIREKICDFYLDKLGGNIFDKIKLFYCRLSYLKWLCIGYIML